MTTISSTSPGRILIVEDESDLRDAIAAYLEIAGHEVRGVSTITGAEKWLARNACDILVLDLGLPDGDGLQWLRSRPDLRGRGIIITSARGNNEERLEGIKAGADIYLVKPVLQEELASLIENLLHRLESRPSSAWRLNSTKWLIESPEGIAIQLTHSEHVLLGCLASTPGQPVAREQMIHRLGHDPAVYDPRRLEIMVRRLRNKCKDILGYALPLETAPRQGYAFIAAIVVG